MKDLVFKTTALSTAEPYTTSDVIAKYSDNTHHAIQQLIKANQKHLEELGNLAFEMRKIKKGRGAKVKLYHLNEQQATFLITLLRNTPNVVAFKLELTKQFYKVREELKQRKKLRLADKTQRKTLTDSIQTWQYANQWSYKAFTDLLSKCATGMTSKQLKKQRNAKSSVITELMTVDELNKYERLEKLVIAMLDLNYTYQQIKDTLNDKREEV